MQIRCKDLTFRYNGSKHYLLKDMSFTMENPGFNALFGPSGVGKTSFARILAKDITHYDGTLETSGVKTILYSYNLERLPCWSSVGKHISKINSPGKNSLKDDLIDVFGLADCIDSRFSMLSMGQQNRINLIRYLLQDFDVLIMDESLANVDEKSRERIILKMKELFPDKMFLYISHNLMEVAKFCREILVFSLPSKKKGSFLINGQNYSSGYSLNKDSLDKTMLEIMNAF